MAPVLGGSWDLVTRVIIKVTTHITTYNPIKVLITILTKSHDPSSRYTPAQGRFGRCSSVLSIAAGNIVHIYI